MARTAVQQIFDVFQMSGYVGFSMWIDENFKDLLKQERQQIIDAWVDGNASANPETIYGPEDGERYYNETFTGKK